MTGLPADRTRLYRIAATELSSFEPPAFVRNAVDMVLEAIEQEWALASGGSGEARGTDLLGKSQSGNLAADLAHLGSGEAPATEADLRQLIERLQNDLTWERKRPGEAPTGLTEENERLRAALETAADDLGKAANQFASMRESQRAGHTPEIVSNPEKFEAKEARARAALRGRGSEGE